MTALSLAAGACGPHSGVKANKAQAGKIAGMASRINTLLSVPMLVAMTMHQTLTGA